MSKVLEYHKEGYNCCESLIKSYNDVADLNIPVCVGTPFGGGMAVAGICGAVTGALIVLGGLEGRNSAQEKNLTRIPTKEILNKFNEKYGTLQCKELKSRGISCDELIEFGYEVLQQYI